MIQLNDFHKMTVDVGERKHRSRTWFRDHGHERRIRESYRMVRPQDGQSPGCAVRYVWETAELFLATREALDHDRVVVVQPYDESRLGNVQDESRRHA